MDPQLSSSMFFFCCFSILGDRKEGEEGDGGRRGLLEHCVAVCFMASVGTEAEDEEGRS